MPVVQPQNWNPLNPAIGEGLGWAWDKGQELWNKIPNDIRRNLQFMSDAPNPGFPVGATDDLITGGIKGAVAIPAMVANPKTRAVLKKMMGGLDLGDAISAVRNQQENYPFPFAQWLKDRLPRGGIFFSPGSHKFEYGEMGMGAAEGGPYKVEWLQKLKNPLVIQRDENGFLAEHVIRKLLGSQSIEKSPGKYMSVPNQEGQDILDAIRRTIGRDYSFDPANVIHPEDKQNAINKLLNYIEPKQLESSLAARDPKTSLGEAIASELARKAGYDSIISTRPKTVIKASQKMANHKTISNVVNQFTDFEKRFKGTLPKESLQRIFDKYRDIIMKTEKRGGVTELMPTQVLYIDKPELKKMRQKGIDYYRTGGTEQLPFNPATMSQMGKDFISLYKGNMPDPSIVKQAIQLHGQYGNLSPAEVNYLNQTLFGAFQ